MKKMIGLAVLAAAAVLLVACPAAAPPVKETPTVPTVSREDFNKFWQVYLRQFHGAKIHFSAFVGLRGGAQRNFGFYHVIDSSLFRVGFIEGEGFLASTAAYRISLRAYGEIRNAVHVSNAQLSTNDQVLVQIPFSVSATLPGFGSLTVKHNYRLEGYDLVFTIITTAFPT